MAPAAAMEILLGLPPPHLQVEAGARAGIYRLYCSKQWKPKSEGHACVSGHERRTHPTEGADLQNETKTSLWKDGFILT